MKILLVSPYPPERDGIAKYSLQVRTALQAQGDEVTVLSPRPSAAPYHADLRTWSGLVRAARLARRADRTIVEMVPDLFFGGVGRLRRLFNWPLLALFLRSGHVELVAHELPVGTPEGLSAARLKLSRALWRSIVSLPATTYVHTVREREQAAAALNLPPGRLQLLPHGATFRAHTVHDRASAREELGLAPDAFCFLCIGFLQRHKGFDRAVDALSRLPGENLRLDIVGSRRWKAPEIDDYMRELIAVVAAVPRAHLHEGFLSDERFDTWLVASDVVVLPYRDIWSSGVVERARLFGRPLIVTDVGGLRDQVAGQDASLVNDDEELVRAMARAAGLDPDGILTGVPEDVRQAREAAMAAVRERADRLRQLHEPGAPSPSDPVLGGAHGVVLPSPESGGYLRRLSKRIVFRLTRWLFAPLVDQVNDRLDELSEQQRRLAARLDEIQPRSRRP